MNAKQVNSLMPDKTVDKDHNCKKSLLFLIFYDPF